MEKSPAPFSETVERIPTPFSDHGEKLYARFLDGTKYKHAIVKTEDYNHK